MDQREVAVTQITSPEAASEADPGRRERKKQRTRDALFEAAMELFAAKGYDRTAVHEITDAVDVSERTFFRYFASKEDLVISFIRERTEVFLGFLAARPAAEEPLTAHASTPGDDTEKVETYLSVIRLIEATPALLAANLRFLHDHEDEIVGV